MAEFQTYDVDWVDDLLTSPLEVEDGYVKVPKGSGFGIELDDEIVKEHTYTEDKVHTIDLWETGWEKREMSRR